MDMARDIGLKIPKQLNHLSPTWSILASFLSNSGLS